MLAQTVAADPLAESLHSDSSAGEGFREPADSPSGIAVSAGAERTERAAGSLAVGCSLCPQKVAALDLRSPTAILQHPARFHSIKLLNFISVPKLF